MHSVTEEAAQRTNLALSNQMEMLTFYLTDEQLYGINVFKIIEMIETPPRISRVPQSHPSVCGVIDFRGKPITVIDLSQSVGLEPVDFRQELSHVIICEYNNNVHGFLVSRPEQLLNRNWEDIRRPTGLLTKSASLVAIAYGDNEEAIQLLDIERILAEVLGLEQTLTPGLAVIDTGGEEMKRVLVVDDSRAARMFITSVLEQMGIPSVALDSGQGALDYLAGLAEQNELDEIGMIISDIEMPGMDGFTFTRLLKENPRLSSLHVLLHTSMSNPSNRLKAEQVGADDFLAKFNPDELAGRVSGVLTRRKAA